MILIRRKWVTSVQQCRTFQGADIDSDHSLVMANIKIKLKKKHGVRRAGYKNSLTTIRSMIRERTGVMDIGLKSEWLMGVATLGTGHIEACFHCCGTMELDRDRLNSRARGLQNTDAPSRRYHAGN